MGPGRELYRNQVRPLCNWVANGQQTPSMGWEGYLKGLAGPADDVTPHHYGTCNIYRMFSDVVYVTVPATAVCKMALPILHALTTSQVSVTKAGGLSDTPGAERSRDRKTEIL